VGKIGLIHMGNFSSSLIALTLQGPNDWKEFHSRELPVSIKRRVWFKT
jgi:hypothetical protein